MRMAADLRRLDARRRHEGWIAFALFCLTIPLANWMIGNVGTRCIPGGPCLVPVVPGLEAPSGVLTVGLALVLRDLVQRRLGPIAGFAAILAGTALSVVLAAPSVVAASALAFFLSEVADFAVYSPLQRRRFVLAVIASGLVGIVVDSLVFLQVAFGSLDFLAGQVVGKVWMLALAMPFVIWLRRRDGRLGLAAR